MYRKACFIALWLAGIAVACALASVSFFTISEQEFGLILRNGKIISEVGPGLGWHRPFTDQVIRISSQNNILSIADVHNYTSDLHEFTVDVSIVWHLAPNKIADIYTRYNDIRSVELAFIKPRVSSQVGLVMSRHKGIQMFEKPDQFIKETVTAIKLATDELVVIDSVSFEKLALADLERAASSERPAAEAVAAPGVLSETTN